MSDYEVFGEICESTLIGYRNQLKTYDAKQIADLIFLYFIALQVLKSNFSSVPFASDYASSTNNGSFDNFNLSGTDLDILIHALFGKNNESAFNILNNQEASRAFRKKLNFNAIDAKRWLSNIKNVNVDTDQQFLLRLENGLRIDNSNYKSMRRLAGEWTDLNQDSRQLVMTRLLFAFQTHAAKSELLPALNKVAKTQNLVIKDASNPEKAKPRTSNFLKVLGLGAAITTGVAAHVIARTIKNIDKHSSRK